MSQERERALQEHRKQVDENVADAKFGLIHNGMHGFMARLEAKLRALPEAPKPSPALPAKETK